MRIAFVNVSTGIVQAVLEPEVQLSPIMPEAGIALVFTDSHECCAALTSTEIVGMTFDFQTSMFIMPE